MSSSSSYPQERFRNVKLSEGSFWHQWRTVARTVTAPTQLAQLKKTGRYDAFDLKWQDYYKQPMHVWPVPQHLFWESDVAKFVEAACYLLMEQEDAALREAVDHLVNLIESAQQTDGYLNIHFVVCEPEKRWSNLRDLHELYNAGHLIESAVAHFQLTGSRQFVDVMIRFIRYTATVFGPNQGQKHGYPGHPEIELALLRLYAATGDTGSLELADYFIRQRGHNGGEYYRQEQEARGEHTQLAPAMMPKAHSYWYMQAHKPIVEQETIEGHSVRAMYLLTAVADLCLLDKKKNEGGDLHKAVERLWRDCCTTKTAVTGGIGTVHQWEGFGLPYAITHAEDEGGSYNETCASIGQLMLVDRMQLLDGVNGARFGDVAERALYNASLTTGMSLDGRAFTYDNALASCDGHPCVRHTWFECACCPPNVLRSLAVVAGYFWSPTKDALAVHHFFDGTINDDKGAALVTMKTEYPWDGKVDIEVASNGTQVRIPGWATKSATLNGAAVSPKDGYITLDKGKHAIDLHIKPRLIHGHPNTYRDTLTVAYGPLIYCLEDVDNAFEKQHFKNLTMHASVQLTARRSEAHGNVVVIDAKQSGRQLDLQEQHEAEGIAESDGNVPLQADKLDLLFVPYYYRANRAGSNGQMRTSIRQRYTEP